MSGIGIEATIGIVIALATGVFISVLVAAAVAYRREDRRGSIFGPAPDPLCQGVRRLTGVWTTGPVGWFVPPQRTGSEDAQRSEAAR